MVTLLLSSANDVFNIFQPYYIILVLHEFAFQTYNFNVAYLLQVKTHLKHLAVAVVLWGVF